MRNLKWMLGLLTLMSTQSFAMNMRGTHNNWGSEKMLCNYRYGLVCKAIVTFQDEAVFKFDKSVDWKNNFGIAGKVYCEENGSCTGKLAENGENIELPANKSYAIQLRIWGDTREFTATPIKDQAQDLPEGVNVLHRNYVGISGGYGSYSVKVNVIARRLNPSQQVCVQYNYNGLDNADGWKLACGIKKWDYLPSGAEVWSINFGGFGHVHYRVMLLTVDADGNATTYTSTETYYTGQ